MWYQHCMIRIGEVHANIETLLACSVAMYRLPKGHCSYINIMGSKDFNLIESLKPFVHMFSKQVLQKKDVLKQ